MINQVRKYRSKLACQWRPPRKEGRIPGTEPRSYCRPCWTCWSKLKRHKDDLCMIFFGLCSIYILDRGYSHPYHPYLYGYQCGVYPHLSFDIATHCDKIAIGQYQPSKKMVVNTPTKTSLVIYVMSTTGAGLPGQVKRSVMAHSPWLQVLDKLPYRIISAMQCLIVCWLVMMMDDQYYQWNTH